MKKYYEFVSPVKLISGENAIQDNLAKQAKSLGCMSVLIISGPVINRLGITDFVANVLEDSNIKVAFKYTNVPNDSSLKVVDEICKLYKANSCDSIVAVGGGSVLDTAKAVRLQLSQGKDNLQGLFGYNMSKIGIKLPFIAIPTTCGTGSEVTKVSVICDETRGAKEEIISDILLPDVAILDPKMLETLPKKSILLTAFDTLAHAIEGYCGKGKNPLSDRYSLQAIKLIINNLPNALDDNCDKGVYLKLLQGATLAGISFSNSMVGAVHAIAHSVGSVLNVGHDFAVATLLPFVLKYNIECSINDYAILYDWISNGNSEQLTFKEKAERLPSLIYDFLQENASKIGGIPTFSDCGLSTEKFDIIANLSLTDGAILTNARLMSYNDIVNILEAVVENKL